MPEPALAKAGGQALGPRFRGDDEQGELTYADSCNETLNTDAERPPQVWVKVEMLRIEAQPLPDRNSTAALLCKPSCARREAR